MSDRTSETLHDGSQPAKTMAELKPGGTTAAALQRPAPTTAPSSSSPTAAAVIEDPPSQLYTIAAAPTLQDLRAPGPGGAEMMAARRTRSRTLSMSRDPREAALGRALSRVASPPQVGLFGDVSPAFDDLSGLAPPLSAEEAERDERRRVAELEGGFLRRGPSINSGAGAAGSGGQARPTGIAEDVEEGHQGSEGHEGELEGEKDEVWEVSWDGPDDKSNPKNWSPAFRWYLTAAGGILVLNATFASSAPSGVIPQMVVAFDMSREVATLLIAIFVGGYCLGPLIWAPLSEVYGRRITFLVSFFVYWMFQIGCALAPNTAAIMLFRFFSGAFAACPLTNAGGVIGDIWDSDRRGIAMAFFSLAPFAGPAIGPMVSGYMATAGVPWPDLFWVTFAFAGLCFFIILFTVPETYSPKILASKAAARRKATGESRWYAPLERQSVRWQDRVQNILVKPFAMLFKEPMLLSVTLYMSFVYGILYLLFEAVPIVFSQPEPVGHGFSEGATGLMFLALFLGGAAAVGVYIGYFNPRYVKKHHEVLEKGGMMVAPEVRLEMALVGAVTFPIALFWFGWTSFSSISYWSPLLALGLLGFSILFLFLALFNYIIDVYLFAAASALAGNTVCRSAFGTGFPMFATQMFETLNPRIASTVLGAIAVAFMPVPFLFIKFGPQLRARSRYSPHAKKK